MTSAINYSAISTTYPVAGQDNDSQGFRDNFTAIKAGLQEAATELTALQTVAVITADLATQTTPVVNNMLGSTISNGLFVQFNGVFFNGGAVTSANISLNNGPVQQFTITGAATLTFENWPASGQYGVIRVILIGDQVTTRNVTFSTANAGLIKLDSAWINDAGTVSQSLPATLQLNASGGYTVVEAWSVNAGTTVYMKQIGHW
jgi:hypothetical protein